MSFNVPTLQVQIPGHICSDDVEDVDNLFNSSSVVQTQLDELHYRLTKLEIALEHHLSQKCSELACSLQATRPTSVIPDPLLQASDRIKQRRSMNPGTHFLLGSKRCSTVPRKSSLQQSTDINLGRCAVARTSSLEPFQVLEESFLEGEEVVLYTLKGSTWDAMILVGLPIVSLADSVFLVLNSLLNIFLQAVFCYIAYRNLASTTATTLPSQESARRWRENSAHIVENADSTTWRSLATRVCSGDASLITSFSQMYVIGLIDAYRDRVFADLCVGALLCFVVLTVWLMMVINELQDVSDALSALFWLPRSNGSVLQAVSQRLCFEGLSLRRRYFIVVILMLRFSIAILLGVSGAIWLANTIDLAGLVVNGAALLFIFQIDELIFETLMPERIRQILERIVPLQRFNALRFRGVEPYKVFAFFAIFGPVTALLATKVTQLGGTLDVLKWEYCVRGNTDFVVSLNPTYGFAVAGRTNPFYEAVQGQNLSLLRMTANQFIDLDLKGRDTDSWFAWFLNTQGEFEHISSSAYVYATDYVPYCGDFFVLDQHKQLFLTALSAKHNLPGKICEDFKQFCGDLDAVTLRWVCPATCGCSDPFSGLLNLKGCKPSCLQRRRNVSDSVLPCRDQRQDCFTTAAMRRYAANFNKHFKPMTVPEGLNNGSGCSAIASLDASNYEGNLLCLDESLSSTVSVGSLLSFCPVSCFKFSYRNYSGQCPQNTTENIGTVGDCRLGLCQGYSTLANHRAKLDNNTRDKLVALGYEVQNSEIQCPSLDDAIADADDEDCSFFQSHAPDFKKLCCSQYQSCETRWQWNITEPVF